MIRTMDDLGRVAIPKSIRKNLGIQEGAQFEIEVDAQGIIKLILINPSNDYTSYYMGHNP